MLIVITGLDSSGTSIITNELLKSDLTLFVNASEG